MNTPTTLNRRDFLRVTALATAAMPLASSAANSPEPAPAKGKPKVGCLSWCFHDFSPGVDPERAIDTVGELGFDGIELIVTASRDLKGFWTDTRVDHYKQKLEQNKLQVSQFVLFQPVVEGLSSRKPDERELALDHFEAGCRIGQRLGARLINIVAPWARELRGPGDYLPRYYELPHPKPGEKFHIDIASGFDWDSVWAGYVETTRACLERAKAHDLKFSIEQHTHTLMPEAASFRRLWDEIRDPALGYNLDAGWTMLQREYPPVAVYKVRHQLLNLHMRDIDGLMRRFPMIGDGVMDFKAIVDALKDVGFDGFASIEQDKNPGDMKETCRRYLRMMREYIG
ncbi:MAG TPA: TIM barrel protein [Verrucomicrobiae bacterium]|nr:TIM barrel protein [Verrucomicrobiae bacterium]